MKKRRIKIAATTKFTFHTVKTFKKINDYDFLIHIDVEKRSNINRKKYKTKNE